MEAQGFVAGFCGYFKELCLLQEWSARVFKGIGEFGMPDIFIYSVKWSQDQLGLSAK